MARTGQPSRERVAAASRSLAILDVLAAEGELGTNEIARRTGAVPSTVSRQLATLVGGKAIADVNHGGGQAFFPQGATQPESWFRKEMRLEVSWIQLGLRFPPHPS